MIVISADDGVDALEDLFVVPNDLGDGLMDAAMKERICKTLAKAERFCVTMQLEFGKGGLDAFRDDVLSGPCSAEVAKARCHDLWHTIRDQLKQRKLAFISPERAELLEQEALFGERVRQAFPSASSEIKAVGNCLAADLNTAAVFHLMRVVEIGLRALAKKLHVAKVRKNVPLERGTWGDVIQALQARIGGGFNKTRKGQRDSDFYNGLFIEFRAFKDLWRNKVMHTRMDYDEQAARAAFEHVRSFMQRLADAGVSARA